VIDVAQPAGLTRTRTMLSHFEFQEAVKAALRSYTRPDLLAVNPLLSNALIGGSGKGLVAHDALRTLLLETAETLFASERDQRLRRVIEVTYFNPESKQEAAALKLGLSFSTYRRSLIAGTDRLTKWLWQKEQELRAGDPGAAPAPPSPRAQDSPAVRPRLSLIVLPFLNLTQDPGQDYLVDGIVDAVITDLSSNLPGSFVISRSTSFTYKDRKVPVRQIGEELGVRYVLEGSVLVDAAWLRVNAQLIDAETDVHLWAERFDKPRAEILRVQDEIVGRLSRTVGIQLVRTEAGRGNAGRDGADAIDLVMRARALIFEARRKEITEEAIGLFRRALQLDPRCVDAMVGISLARVYDVINLYVIEDREASLDEAERMIAEAAALAPDHFEMLMARALLSRARGRFAEALTTIEALIERNPAEPTAYKEMGLNNIYLGRTREAVDWFRRADVIAPRDPERWTWLQGLGRGLMQLGDDAAAVSVLRQALDNNPGHVRGKAMLAAAKALKGDIAGARQQLADYLTFEPEMNIGRFAEERSSVPPDAVSPVYRSESARILEGLRLAGMRGD
jgi:TolB-like protein/Flp pilus assembly protein TadD